MATKTKSTKVASKKVEAINTQNTVKNVSLGKGKKITGLVVSDKMLQTVVVEVTRLVSHPLYQKRMRRTNKFHAHNTVGAKKGDLVEIVECPPISKLKHFTVSSIIKNK